jgi:hypothetical protein
MKLSYYKNYLIKEQKIFTLNCPFIFTKDEGTPRFGKIEEISGVESALTL